MKSIRIALSLLFFLTLGFAVAETAERDTIPPYKNPSLPIDVRVTDLVSRMTLDEKIGQMMNAADSIPRLGIPDYNWWSEGLHGVANSGIATVFPQAIGLGATWDDGLIRRVADVISTEFRAKFNDYQQLGDHSIFRGLTVWSPNINIFRDPRWGRGQETYGEDPFLTSRIGVAFVQGMQGNDPKYLKVVATPKHYAVHSGPEPMRHQFDAEIDYRDFAETYSPAFKACVTEGGAYSIMGAYQRYLGVPCCASELLLHKVLREKWNFKGYVVSDCGAIDDMYRNHRYVKTAEEAAAISVLAGCDLECGDTYSHLKYSVEQGLIHESDIDVAVKRLFTARFKLGLFDPPEMVPYAQIPITQNDSPEHRALALTAARESMVLLKNADHTLPLKKEIKTIAVLGPNANIPEVLYGNYNGISSHAVTPLEGIRNRTPQGVKVLYEPASGITDESPLLLSVPAAAFSSGDGTTPGLKAEYFDNMELKGTPVLSRTDSSIDFDFIGTPPRQWMLNRFSVRWTGWLEVPVTDTYTIGFMGDDGYRVFLDDKLIIEDWQDHGPQLTTEKIALVKGKKYPIRIEYYQNMGAAVARLQWTRNNNDPAKNIAEVVRNSDVVVFVGGITPWLEGEEMPIDIPGFRGGDRTAIDLPSAQQRVLEEIVSLGKPLILVLLNGGAVTVNWADKQADAIVEAWYPGEEGGNALADVLFGMYNPGGRLPVTVYKSIDDLPPFTDYNMANRTYRYFTGTPLYEFGYGLSYTTFKYSGLKVPSSVQSNESVKVSVDVKNTGSTDGDEVAELYVKLENAKAPVPIHALRGFKRIFLKAGEKKNVEFELKPEDISLIDNNNRRVVEPGTIRLFVGGCQPSEQSIKDGKVLTEEILIGGNETIIE